MSDLAWLGAAFGVAWLILGIYLVRLWRAQRAIDERLSELSKGRGEQPLG